jgi:S-adenosylmethionine:tRNA ribosyltransferase-isomerase
MMLRSAISQILPMFTVLSRLRQPIFHANFRAFVHKLFTGWPADNVNARVAFAIGISVKPGVRTSEFSYDLPPELIAQQPAERRDQSRLLVLTRATGEVIHRRFHNLRDFLRPGDVLVLNNSKVIPARLRGVNGSTGGAFEVLLLEEHAVNDWEVMLKPGRRARLHTQIMFADRRGLRTGVQATVVGSNEEGHRRLRFSGTANIADALWELGEVPLPPYIKRGAGADLDQDGEQYQTVYAAPPGSVAAPTAGLHFTPELMADLRTLGVEIGYVTLHVGLGTFAPVKAEHPAGHVMHEERYVLTPDTARAVHAAKREGRRVIAVGTTTVRVLESVAALHQGQLAAGAGRTRIFIYPPFRFQIVDALLTNFHLPCSTLLMLVSAFAAPDQTGGRELVLGVYAEAVRQRYRFFSYGDAMLIL